MKNLFKKIMPVAMAVAMVLVGFVPALPTQAENTVGKTLVTKKVLTKAEAGVTTPTETFTFEATAHSFNGDTTKTTTCPALTNGTAAYGATDDTDADTTAPGKQLAKLSGDMLDNVKFTQAGQYTYTIKEKAGSTTGITYSKAEYLASLFVVKNANGDFVVDSIMIKKTKNDDGTAATDTKTEYKPDINGNHLEFNNVYDKKAGNPDPKPNDPNDPNTPNAADKKGLVINKIVKADDLAQGTSYGFSLTLTAPAGATAAAVAAVPTAKIVKPDGTTTDVTMSAYGTATTFNLEAGEKIVLNDVLLGSTAKVEEKDPQGYTPSVAANGNGEAVSDLAALKDTGIILGDQAAGNYASFTNVKQTATGILLHNLPYIVLIIVAAAGITLYVRNRRRAYKEF